MTDITDEIKNFKQPQDENTRQLIKRIIDIGNGIYEKPNDEALDRFSLTEAKKNKKEWTKLSKNNEFIARHNPYIRENFNKMSALDIYRNFFNEIKSYANMSFMTPVEFTKKLEETRENMIQAFENEGITVKNYHDFVERFNEDCLFFMDIHLQNNGEYTYQTVLTKNSEDLSYLLENKTKPEDIKSVTDKKISECVELGIPKIDIVNIVVYGFQNFIAENNDKIDLDILVSVLNNLSVENQKFTEIVHDFNIVVETMVQTAMREFSKNQKIASDREYFTKQLNKTLSLKEFLVWFKSNKNSYPDEIDKVILELIQKYSVEENSFLHSVLEQKFLLKNSYKLDVFVIIQMEKMSLKGILGIENIEKALFTGYIGLDDALRFIENLEKPIKPEVLKLEETFSDRIFDGNPELLTKKAIITIDLANDKITLEEAEKKVIELFENLEKQQNNNN